PEKEIICYCNTGVRSAHTVWVLKLLGYPKVKNYNGSWAAWTDAGLPLERGERT
ncbi:MAG: thiosulfate/3-mercaptopyruvate sulfurtransferase, partial [Clostridia bacterium]|nr:thiosulfate/3-mercaptopyruvate sulfurtransferase [Clostridia bacterium]